MEDPRLDIVISRVRPRLLDSPGYPQFTLVAATTRSGMLTGRYATALAFRIAWITTPLRSSLRL